MNIIKDSDCCKDSHVIYGYPEKPVYGLGIPISPRYPGKRNTAYAESIYLPVLLPLEEYDVIVVLFSGGKDASAAYFKLLELGVPKSKIELWHHQIDGSHINRKMDWPVTLPYVEAFAKAEGVRLRLSWRVDGFFGELYRIGASRSIVYEGDSGLLVCPPTHPQADSDRLRRISNPNDAEMTLLKSYGMRLKFPAKSSNLNVRWCSSILKITVGNAVIRHLEQTSSNANILIVSGERRGESAGRARYNEMELHTTHAPVKAHRIVHHWRAVIDDTLRDVWERCRRHKLTPHPCYTCGWGRCSCATCIFSLPAHWAGIRELFPLRYSEFKEDERVLGFTLDHKKNLDEFVGDARSCVCRDDPDAIRQLVSGQFFLHDIYSQDWRFPAGAFKGTGGGPC